MKKIITILSFIALSNNIFSQSFEIMPGTKRIFIDVQWLKSIDQEYKWTLFSRSRATSMYNSENENNLFTFIA